MIGITQRPNLLAVTAHSERSLSTGTRLSGHELTNCRSDVSTVSYVGSGASGMFSVKPSAVISFTTTQRMPATTVYHADSELSAENSLAISGSSPPRVCSRAASAEHNVTKT